MKNFRVLLAILVVVFLIGSSPVQAFQIGSNPLDGFKTKDGKLAWEISKAFSTAVSSDQVAFLKNDLAYGEIALLYSISDSSGKTPSEIFDLRKEGFGWGVIAQKAGIKLSDALPTATNILKSAKFEDEDQALKIKLDQETVIGGKAVTPPSTKIIKEEPKRIGTVKPKAGS